MIKKHETMAMTKKRKRTRWDVCIYLYSCIYKLFVILLSDDSSKDLKEGPGVGYNYVSRCIWHFGADTRTFG